MKKFQRKEINARVKRGMAFLDEVQERVGEVWISNIKPDFEYFQYLEIANPALFAMHPDEDTKTFMSDLNCYLSKYQDYYPNNGQNNERRTHESSSSFIEDWADRIVNEHDMLGQFLGFSVRDMYGLLDRPDMKDELWDYLACVWRIAITKELSKWVSNMEYEGGKAQ